MSLDELEKLAKLKESGVLTEDEFQAKKASILSENDEKPKKKKSNIRTILIIAVGLWVGWAIISGISKNYAALAQLPACNSTRAIETLTDAFDQAQFARSYNLSAVDITDAKQVTDGKDIRTCYANIVMNNSESVAVNYKMEKRSDGGFMLSFEVE